MPQANTISNITPATMQVQFTIAASAAANTTVNAVFVPFTGAASVSTLTVPPDQVWALTRLYASATLSVNMLVNYYVGQTPQSLNTDTAVMVVSSSSLNPINPFEVHAIIDSSQTFYFTGTTDSANGTSAVTETLYLQMIQYPVVIAQQLNAKGIAL